MVYTFLRSSFRVAVAIFGIVEAVRGTAQSNWSNWEVVPELWRVGGPLQISGFVARAQSGTDVMMIAGQIRDAMVQHNRGNVKSEIHQRGTCFLTDRSCCSQRSVLYKVRLCIQNAISPSQNAIVTPLQNITTELLNARLFVPLEPLSQCAAIRR